MNQVNKAFFKKKKLWKGRFKEQLGGYGQKKKSKGRCSSAFAKFTVIGKFLVGGEGTEEEEREQEGKGRRQGSNYKVLNSCSACPMSFPVSLMAERIQARDRKEQAERRVLP